MDTSQDSVAQFPSRLSITWNKSSANPWSKFGSSEGSKRVSLVKVDSRLTTILPGSEARIWKGSLSISGLNHETIEKIKNHAHYKWKRSHPTDVLDTKQKMYSTCGFLF